MKRHMIVARLSPLLIAGICLAALCGPDQSAFALTHISYTVLSQDTVWGPGATVSPDSLYVLDGDLIVDEGYTLTIQAGTTVKVASGGSITVGAGTSGRLVIAGTAGAPVVLDAESGAIGGWDGITLTATATGCQIANAAIKHAQVGLLVTGTDALTLSGTTIEQCGDAALRLTDASPTVTGSTFRGAANAGVDVTTAACMPVWSGNTVGPNGTWQVVAEPNAVGAIASGTTFVQNATPAKYNAIRMLGGKTLEHTATWPALAPGMVYSIAAKGLNIRGPEVPLLTLGDGAVVKVDPMISGSSSNIVVGSTTDPDAQGGLIATNVTFTSGRDDTVGGDTTGDGATVPVAGDWGGVTFLAQALDASALTGCTIRYGGGAPAYPGSGSPLGYGAVYGAITVAGADVTVTGTTLRESASYGVLVTAGLPTFDALHVDGVAGPGISDSSTNPIHYTGCVIENADGDGLHAGPAVIEDCDVHDVSGDGIFAAAATITGTSIARTGGFPISVTAPAVATAADPASGNTLTPSLTGKRNAIEVRAGTISEDAEWPALPAGFAYLIAYEQRVTVLGDPAATLTLASGAVVKFGPSTGGGGTFLVAGAQGDVTAAGAIIADGVTFTAAADDSIAGDTLGDGPIAPVPGSYGGVAVLKSALASRFTGCTFRYGGNEQAYPGYNTPLGYGALYGAITAAGPAVEVTDCTFTGSGAHAIRVHAGAVTVTRVDIEGGGAGITDSGPGPLTVDETSISDGTGAGITAVSALVSDTTIEGMGGDGVHAGMAQITGVDVTHAGGVGVWADALSMSETTISETGGYHVSTGAGSVAGVADPGAMNTLVANANRKHDAIEVRSGTIAQDATWPGLPSGFAYLVAANQQALVQGAPAPTLTVGPGAIVKFGANSGGGGTYLVVGSANDGTKLGRLVAVDSTFTSAADDSEAGDTTGNGPVEPTKGSYGGVVFMAFAEPSSISGCSLRYGGAEQAYPGSNSPLGYGALYGAVTNAGADVTLTDTTVTGAGAYGVRASGGTTRLSGCIVTDGTGGGVSDGGAGTLALTSCEVARNAGDGVAGNVVTVAGGTIADNGGMGLRASSAVMSGVAVTGNGGVGVRVDDATITTTSFAGNGSYPVSVAAGSVARVVAPASANTFAATGSGKWNGVEVRDGAITTDSAWPALGAGFAYVVAANNVVAVQGDPFPTLTIGPGAVVKLGPSSGGRGTYLVIGHNTDAAKQGRLVAQDTTFTALADDAIAGDTGGDGPSTPAASWGGLVALSFAKASSLTGCTLRYGGVEQAYPGSNAPLGYGAVYGAVTGSAASWTLTDTSISGSGAFGVRATGGTTTLTGVTVAGGAGDGVRVDGGGSVAASTCTVKDNAANGITAAALTVADSTITGNGAMGVSGAAGTVSGSAITGNGGAGLQVDVVTVTGTTFAQNGGAPVSVGAGSVAGVVDPANANVFAPSAAHKHDVIEVRDGTITQDAAWPALPSGFTYLIASNQVATVAGDANPTLSVGPGAIVKFGASSGGRGTFLVVGSQGDASKLGRIVAEGATFTSADDDSLGGDATGNGPVDPTVTSASIVLLDFAADTSSFTGCTFRYGGGEQAYPGSNAPLGYGAVYGCLTLDHAKPTVTGCRFEGCGVGVRTNADVTITKSVFTANDMGLAVSAGAPQVHDSSFVDNATWGVRNTGAGVVDARDCWWGSGSGPTHASNATGTGDAVTDKVLFDPWKAVSDDIASPSSISDLRVSGVGASAVTLAWTAPGDDGTAGTATSYDVRYDSKPITSAGFATALSVSGAPTPQAAGSPETMTVTGLVGTTTWYFAVKATDDVGNKSALSNGADSGPPRPLSVTPARAQAGSPVSLTVEGTNLFPQATVALVAGTTTVPLTGIVATGSRLTGTADLTGAWPSSYRLRVTNADGKTGELPRGFDVSPGPVAMIVPAGPQRVVVGDTLQLGVSGEFTPASWASSDPSVATVDATGLLAAVSLGDATTTVITATDAAGATLTSGVITVPLDADGDGVRDTWELAHGLDPHVPGDAALDPDGDGVTNLEEFLHGSDPLTFNPSIVADASVGGAMAFVDGTYGYPGRRVGAVPALVAVDTTPRSHFVTVLAPSVAPGWQAVAEQAAAQVRVSLTLGPMKAAAAFEPGAVLATVPGPAAPAPVDLDLDGDADLVVGAGDGSVHWLRGDGGAFTDAGPLLADGVAIDVGQPASPLLVDWTGDGVLDLLVQDATGTVRLFIGAGGGAFADGGAVEVDGTLGAAPLVVAKPAHLAAIDHDGDGARDLLIGQPDGALVLRRNTGSDGAPRLGAPVTLLAGAGGLVTPAPWLSYSQTVGGRPSLVLGDGTGVVTLRSPALPALTTWTTTATQRVDTGTGGRVVAAHLDLTGDGVPDLVVGDKDGAVRVLAGVAEPAAPVGVLGSGTPDFAVVTWKPSTELGLDGYQVYRADTAAGPFVLVAVVPAPLTIFKDFDVALDTPHAYYVTSFSAFGESDPSDVVEGMAHAVVSMTVDPQGPQRVADAGTLTFTPHGGIGPYTFYVMNPASGSIDADGTFTATAGPVTSATLILALDSLDNAAFGGPVTVPADYDGDGLLDTWERGWGFDPTVANGTEDPDEDGLDNAAEQAAGTNPLVGDTDGDGLDDAYELAHGLDPLVDDTTADPDGDGLSNLLEHQWGTDPQVDDRATDADGDWMDTAWEILNGTDPFTADATLDPDGDGLPNLVEYQNATPPTQANTELTDTDGDGLPDQYELHAGTAVNVPDATEDPDGDGLANGIEYLDGTPPTVPNLLLPDGDSDLIPDVWERAYGTGPAEKDATADPDLDDMPNLLEYLSGGLPNTPWTDMLDTDGDGLPDRWEAVMGRDPLVSNAGADADGDDRPDLIEYLTGDNPDKGPDALPDRDHDGMPDLWERAFAPGLDWTTSDGLGNPDFDDVKNQVEWRAGTNPTRQANDTDGDLLADTWELAWGVFDPDGNPDHDIYSNLEEMRNGTNPLKLDPYVPVIAPPYPFVDVDETVQLGVGKAVGPFTWEAGDPGVATVDATGLLTGVSKGWTTVTVTDANGQVGETVAFVSSAGEAPPSLLVVSPGTPQTVVAGQHREFTVTGGTGPYTWATLDPGVGTVDDGGVFTAVGHGGGETTRVIAFDAAGHAGSSALVTVPTDSDADDMPDWWELAHGLAVGSDDAGGDPDHDGASNGDEWAAGTDPRVADTDGDQIPDGWELEHGLDPLADDAGLDVDADGLTNLAEYQHGRDPWGSDAVLDSDGDGMDDAWELAHGLDPNDGADRMADPDGDGLSNAIERRWGTDPHVANTELADSDGDGMPDVWELAHGLDPQVDDARQDADGDGLPNGLEYERGSDPWARSEGEVDHDGDGMPDWYEVAWGFDPAVDDAGGDADGDGRANGVEYRNATNPRAEDVDADGDGLPDRWARGFGVTGADGNPDHDRMTNAEELAAGTSPVVLDAYVVEVAPAEATITVGGSVTLRCSNAVGECAWSSSAADVAAVGAGGVVTGASEGLALITATDSNGFEATAAVAVVPVAVEPPAPLPLGFAPDAVELVEGERAGFAAFGGTRPYESLAVGDDTIVRLTPATDAGGALTGRGVLRALKAGATEVTVRDADGEEATMPVVVDAAVVTLAPGSLTLWVGEIAHVVAAGGTPPYVYGSADGEVATVTADSGEVRATRAGKTTITVKDANGREAVTALEVLNPGLTVAPGDVTIAARFTVPLTAAGGVPPYTWSTSNAKVAPVDADGVVTGRTGGTVTITVTDAVGQTAAATVTVVGPTTLAGGGGCAAGRGGRGEALLPLLLLAAALLLLRRRRMA